jgi:Protein of unknown function (DUF2868)
MSQTRPRPSSLFEDAIDVPIWLETDRRLALATRQHRDRAIGRTLEARGDVERVRAWWGRVERGARADGLPGRRLEPARQWLYAAASVLGLVAGAGAALAAYRYDGTYPVNVVRVLALLVAPQLLLLVLNVALLPGRLPGLRRLQDALAAINPGALVASVYHQLTARKESAVFDWAAAHSSAGRRFAKWQVICWSQSAAVGFNVAALVTATMLITFTDLAFGWSTTLAVDAQTAARAFTSIALPWKALVASAVPDAELVERSQFFRLEGGRGLNEVEPQVLAAWWSFTLLALVVYGLLPRLGFLALAQWRLRAATRALLLEDPQVTALLDRLSVPDLETRAGQVSQAAGARARPLPSKTSLRVSGTADAVIWSRRLDAGDAAAIARDRFGIELDVVAEAGGGHSLASDRAALEQLRAERSVFVFTSAWEPPLLDFVDFLGVLRATIGPGPSIVVVPVGEHAETATPSERDMWARAVNKAGDARIYVETGGS